MNNKSLLTIFVIVFVDLLGFSLILPLLPYYAETFGANPTVTGFLVASYALAQLLGAPLLGRLSDRIGRRPVLLVSIFGTFLGFILLGAARSLWVLFAARIIDGLTGGNISVAQAYITDVSDEKNRAKALGMIGAAFGLGFIIGPAVGGLMSTWGYSVPAFAAAALSLVNLTLVFFFLPESLSPARRAMLALRPRPSFTLDALWCALNRPRVGPLLHTRLFFALASATFQTVFTLYAQYKLGLNARTTGLVLAYVGVLAVIVQGGAIGWMTKRYSDKQLILTSTVVMTLSLAAWAFVPNLWMLLLVLAPLSAANGTLNTVLNSALTKSVYPEEVGGTLGLAASIESVSRVVAPSVGGVLLQNVGTWAPGIFSALVMVWVVTFVWRRIVVNPDPPLPQREGGPALAYAPVRVD
jgi:DHA1 family tetracycline resistance protein-like MFS transporter